MSRKLHWQVIKMLHVLIKKCTITIQKSLHLVLWLLLGISHCLWMEDCVNIFLEENVSKSVILRSALLIFKNRLFILLSIQVPSVIHDDSCTMGIIQEKGIFDSIY